ncbi:MAG: VWA domain-containing protein [Saprospiraceae bacterium]|jgi:nitric oxide reductase NorD protein|nr:VWA domain-containing protein [Saprospiraceae bacterium]HRK80974.1 VWA domain-containing protein [Saprospiraceae bacterium]
MGLELDELLYGWVVKRFKKKRRAAAESQAQRVELAPLMSRLTIVARAITGKAIDIFPAEREGGYKNNNFFLPPAFAELPDAPANTAFYFYRVLYMSVQQRLGYNWQTQTEDLALSRQKALESSSLILKVLFEDYPAARHIHDTLRQHLESTAPANTPPDYFWLYGKWMYNVPETDDNLRLQHVSGPDGERHGAPPDTTLKAKAVEEVKSLTIDKKQQEDYVLLHNFEKVETAEEFNGTWRDFDGSDQLEEHQDALEELNMKFTVRTDDPTHSVYQADFVENVTVLESAEMESEGRFYTYDEWDYAGRCYKPDFCKVYPHRQLKSDAAYCVNTLNKYGSTLMGLRKMLTTVNNRMQQQRRQIQGQEFDIDAVTDMYADLHSRKTPSEKIYLSNRKREKDFSILLLLDISLSSDGYAAGSRVIDVEKEVSILFGEILNEFHIDFSIDSFYSKTRNHSSYLILKDFDENWSVAKNKIGAVQPCAYTRIGAALRHAGARLQQRPTKNKWIVLISDGKPNDYDKYEGKYGIHDVKQALRELNARQIHSYALAIEAQAKYYLPQMFGQNHYQILTTPTELLQSLVKLYDKIRHQI